MTEPQHTCNLASGVQGASCPACTILEPLRAKMGSAAAAFDEPKKVWGHAPSWDAERWLGCDSREDAIAEGRETYGSDATFWIQAGTTSVPEQFFPDADWLCELAGERAGDEVGDAAEDWPPALTNEARAELDALLKAWARKHIPCRFWCADGVAERVAPLTAVEADGKTSPEPEPER